MYNTVPNNALQCDVNVAAKRGFTGSLTSLGAPERGRRMFFINILKEVSNE